MQIKKLLSPAHFQQNLAQTSASEEQVSAFFWYVHFQLLHHHVCDSHTALLWLLQFLCGKHL